VQLRSRIIANPHLNLPGTGRRQHWIGSLSRNAQSILGNAVSYSRLAAEPRYTGATVRAHRFNACDLQREILIMFNLQSRAETASPMRTHAWIHPTATPAAVSEPDGIREKIS
jgi:hypothetical protein